MGVSLQRASLGSPPQSPSSPTRFCLDHLCALTGGSLPRRTPPELSWAHGRKAFAGPSNLQALAGGQSLSLAQLQAGDHPQRPSRSGLGTGRQEEASGHRTPARPSCARVTPVGVHPERLQQLEEQRGALLPGSAPIVRNWPSHAAAAVVRTQGLSVPSASLTPAPAPRRRHLSARAPPGLGHATSGRLRAGRGSGPERRGRRARHAASPRPQPRGAASRPAAPTGSKRPRDWGRAEATGDGHGTAGRGEGRGQQAPPLLSPAPR